MKKLMFSLIILVEVIFIPRIVSAKEYYVSDYDIDEELINIYNAGDTILFSNDPMETNIYIDDEKVSDSKFEDYCFSPNNCKKKYTFEKKVILAAVLGNHTPLDIYYKTVDDLSNMYCICEEKEACGDCANFVESGKFYKSGTEVLTSCRALVPNFYDKEDNEISVFDTMGVGDCQIYRILPKFNNKDVYWAANIQKGGFGYYSVSSSFNITNYVEPKFELTCNKDAIQYEEKANCELSLVSSYNMTDLTFSLDAANLKMSNFKYLDGIRNSGKGNDFVFKIDNDEIDSGKKIVLMTFDVEGVQKDNYLDLVLLKNIVYTDEVVNAKYDNLDSKLNILYVDNEPAKKSEDPVEKKEEVKNPNTTEKIFILIPAIIILVAVITNQIIMRKKRTTN